MKQTLGIGTTLRRQLSTILRTTEGVATPADVAITLHIPLKQAANVLGKLESRGWMMRVKRGVYLPITLEIGLATPVIEDPWIVADRIFAPCYIGGWSAAHHWGFTDQLFNTIIVVTGRKQGPRQQSIKGVSFLLKMIKSEKLFGTVGVWQDRVKVQISDPSRTIIDLMNDPTLGGGIRSVMDMVQNYLRSEYYDPELLIEYGTRLGNGTVFKRLGLLIEILAPDRHDLIEACKERLTQGYSQLEPKIKGRVTSARWRLYLPAALAHWVVR